MSIQTELTRITNAKAAIKTAIEGKGVTVPDGTLLDGMAALVESIEAGGGISYGTITIAEESKPYVITHGLGVRPSIIAFLFYPDGVFSKTMPVITSIVETSNSGFIFVSGNGTSGSDFKSLYFTASEKNGWSYAANVTATGIGFQAVNEQSFALNRKIGIRTYLWIAIA